MVVVRTPDPHFPELAVLFGRVVVGGEWEGGLGLTRGLTSLPPLPPHLELGGWGGGGDDVGTALTVLGAHNNLITLLPNASASQPGRHPAALHSFHNVREAAEEQKFIINYNLIKLNP